MSVSQPFPPPYDDAAGPEPGPDLAGVRVRGGVEYARVPGFRPLRLDLYVPDAARRPTPVVVYVHGGAFLGGSRRLTHPGTVIVPGALAAGWAVAAVEYRLSGEAVFPACLHDVKAAVRWLRRFGPELGLDPDRIATWGESAGGHLAVFAALAVSDPGLEGDVGVTGVSSAVRAAVGWYPPTDLLTMDAQAPADAVLRHDDPQSPESRLLGAPVQQVVELAEYASPVSHVSAAAAPMLLLHGDRDRVVPCLQSVELDEALRLVRGRVTLRLVEGADHVFDGVPLPPLVDESVAFLRSHLD